VYTVFFEAAFELALLTDWIVTESPDGHNLPRSAGLSHRLNRKIVLLPKTDFRRAFKPITPVQTFREKHSTFALSEFMISCRHPVSIRGALRGRHGR